MSQDGGALAAKPDVLATEILRGLMGFAAAQEFVLGGYFALKTYVDYRVTHDLDAWWRTGRTERAMDALRQVMGATADRHGLSLSERTWGETSSLELSDGERKIFSFQVALRSVELEPPVESEWPPVLVESLADNVGSKMNALVQRGAPRDFSDIHEVVQHGVASVAQCWGWWEGKNPNLDRRLARAQALHHLEAIERRRPLDEIRDAAARERARTARAWIRRSLLGVPARDEERA